jgi:hypothetical protein
MNIQIHQTLHGYKDGHQLLAISTGDLTVDEKQELLFQSDLTGSNFTEEFKIYITGYPINESNSYAFSKTWYADEMKRPGCAWTHTLLIKFSDLGKIPELTSLLNLFRRPTLDKYEFYLSPIEMDVIDPAANNVEDTEWTRLIMSALYTLTENSIIIPASSPTLFEAIILNIWSNQWPRLRRNFTFCTASLNSKVIREKNFDIQITPLTNLPTLQRQISNIYVLEKDNPIKHDFLDIVFKYPKNKLRRFLWKYGSDIGGTRDNYLPLIELFDIIQTASNVDQIFSKLRATIQSKKLSDHFANRLLSEKSFLPSKFSDKEIVLFLIENEDNFPNSEINLLLKSKLSDLIAKDEISYLDLYKYWEEYPNNSSLKEAIDKVAISETIISYLESFSPTIVKSIIRRKPELASNEKLWSLNYSTQQAVLNELIDSRALEPGSFIFPILKSQSNIISEFASRFPQLTVFNTLHWLNLGHSIPASWGKEISAKYFWVIEKWLSNQTNLEPTLWNYLFSNLEPKQLRSLALSGNEWLSFYKLVTRGAIDVNRVAAAATILSVGFSRKDRLGSELVRESFHDVYSFAAASKIDWETWKLIPQDLVIDDDESGMISFIMTTIFSLKKKDHIDDWDFCEILVRTIAHKFIKNNWSIQYFLDSLNNQAAFNRTIGYCLSFKRGRKFVKRICDQHYNKKVVANQFQMEILMRISFQTNF